MANIQIIQGNFEKKLKLQFAPGIRAGFPSPAEDYNHDTLDFNRDLFIAFVLIRTILGKDKDDDPPKRSTLDFSTKVIDSTDQAAAVMVFARLGL
jgi:hypothetical protein